MELPNSTHIKRIIKANAETMIDKYRRVLEISLPEITRFSGNKDSFEHIGKNIVYIFSAQKLSAGYSSTADATAQFVVLNSNNCAFKFCRFRRAWRFRVLNKYLY